MGVPSPQRYDLSMTDSRTAEISALKQRAGVAERDAARAEASAEAAQGERDRALTRLQEEFGVGSREEAEALLVKIDGELDAEMEKVRAALEASQ